MEDASGGLKRLPPPPPNMPPPVGPAVVVFVLLKKLGIEVDVPVAGCVPANPKLAEARSGLWVLTSRGGSRRCSVRTTKVERVFGWWSNNGRRTNAENKLGFDAGAPKAPVVAVVPNAGFAGGSLKLENKLLAGAGVEPEPPVFVAGAIVLFVDPKFPNRFPPVVDPVPAPENSPPGFAE